MQQHRISMPHKCHCTHIFVVRWRGLQFPHGHMVVTIGAATEPSDTRPKERATMQAGRVTCEIADAIIPRPTLSHEAVKRPSQIGMLAAGCDERSAQSYKGMLLFGSHHALLLVTSNTLSVASLITTSCSTWTQFYTYRDRATK